MAKKKMPEQPRKLKIRSGDTVEVIAGNDAGKRGRVLRVIPSENRLVVEGVNIRSKHQSETRTSSNRTMGAGMIQFEMPINLSNVMLIDPETDEPTRVGWKVEAGKKVRIAKKSGAVLDK